MKVPEIFLALPAMLLLLSCEHGVKKTYSNPTAIKLPPTEQGLVYQFHHAVTLIPDSLEDDRKKFLEDSLKTTIDQWLSNKTGLKADRWVGVVMDDTVGQSIGAGHGSVLQLYIPIPKTNDTASAKYDFSSSVTITMTIDEDEQDMIKARKQFFDGDTVVFSGYFNPISSETSDEFGHPGDFLASPSLELNPTELYKKGASVPSARPEPDTAGLSKAPVKVTARLTPQKFQDDRLINIKVTVKNTSDKQITKLSVRWLVVDKNGHPAKVDGATGIWLSGFFNKDLDPGATETEEWQHESLNGEKIQLVFPKSVTFYNGLKWVAGKH